MIKESDWMGRLNIAVAIDENYLKAAYVMFHSLFVNHSDDKIIIYLIYNKENLKRKSRRLLAEYVSSHHARLVCIPIREEFQNYPLLEHISVTTYYRLLLPYILPKRVKKILYLDVDLVVDGSLHGLYDREFNGKYFYGVRMPDIAIRHRKRKLGMPPGAPYVNAGVLLYNIEELRKNVRKDELILYLRENIQRLETSDQCLINGMFWNKMGCASERYNWTLLQKPIENKRCIIVHYAGPHKPWKWTYENYGKDVFFKYVTKNECVEWNREKYLQLLVNKIRIFIRECTMKGNGFK